MSRDRIVRIDFIKRNIVNNHIKIDCQIIQFPKSLDILESSQLKKKIITTFKVTKSSLHNRLTCAVSKSGNFN